jgi:hypothetical protein
MMAKPQESLENKKLAFSFVSGMVGKFRFDTPTKLASLDDFNVSYHIAPVITSSVEREFIYIRLTVSGKIKETEEDILSIDALFTFRIPGLIDFVTIKDPKTKDWDFKVPTNRNIILSMINVSVSTMRGILLEKLRGTILHSKPLPLINPKVFVAGESKSH